MVTGTQCLSPATVFDALSARVAESIGYRLGILSGTVCGNTVLAAPDLALHTLTEFADQVRRIMRGSTLSLLVDADHGFGNALNVMRTVEELEHAGVAALTVEDLAVPTPFDAATDYDLISIEEMSGKLRAALAARRDPSLVIAARTAALRGAGAAEAVARARAYAATGVDAIFITGLTKLEDFDAIRAAVKLPIIVGTANSIKRADLAARGVGILLQGHLPVRAVVRALQEVYGHLYNGGEPSAYAPRVATTEEVERLVGDERYRKWRDEYLRRPA